MVDNALAPPKVHTESRKVLGCIRKIVHAVDTHSKRVEKAVGLTTPQLILLMAIYDLGEVTASRLSAYVSLSLATVSTILDKLEGKGLVERYRSLDDRRVVHARLTARGEESVAHAPQVMDEVFLQRFAALSPDDQSRVLAALEHVAAMMEPVRGEK